MNDGMHPEKCEGLEEAVRYFTRDTGIMSSMAVACGAGDRLLTAGNGEAGEDSVFDLASVTKLFTGLCAMKLREEGLLDFSRPVSDYAPAFSGLRDVSVDRLAAFQVTVKTPGRIDALSDREEALACLHSAAPAAIPDRRAYSDIPAMILKYVVEAAAGMPLMDCVRALILRPAGMEETWAKVPGERVKDCELYAPEYRMEKGRRTVRDGRRGIPHDPKAALLQGDSGDLCGHAGLFSTRRDLIRFCRAILSRKIVGEESLRLMAVNRTGRPLGDGTYTQYLGYQCYLRHPDQYFSEIPLYMGLRAFGIAGFTGNHLSVDPERNLFALFLGNRVRGRLTVLTPEAGKSLTDYGLRPDGLGVVQWDDGRTVPSSVQYVHQKDEHFHRVVARELHLAEITWDHLSDSE